MNLNQLNYFISVAELRNFTRAAEQNFISQTAMSQQIKSLEKTVGVPLLVRDKHHVELTAAGRVYLAEAKRIVKAFQGGAHIFNLGHGITPQADPDNVSRLLEAIRG